MHLARPMRDAAYPLLIASQAMPIVVVAPLLILAFDYGIGPKIAIVALICFFPVTVNLLDGLRAVEPDLLKLMRSLGASRLMTLWKVELPWAAPPLFSGLKIAATVSVIGAVFGEWAGADKGLGRPRAAGHQPARDPARVRGRGAADGHGPRSVRDRVARRARGCPLESKRGALVTNGPGPDGVRGAGAGRRLRRARGEREPERHRASST